LHIKNSENDRKQINMTLAEEVTFFNKGAILKELNEIPKGSELEIDISKTKYLDHDVVEIINDFTTHAITKDITIQFITTKGVITDFNEYKETIRYN
jgi:TusA-related sulfurtransferase